MKKYVWIVIAVALGFVGMIVAYTMTAPEHKVAGAAATAAEKSH